MNQGMGAWRRRRVLTGLVGAGAALASPAILRAAPSGKSVRVGGTLSLTGFLAQTAIIHKIAAEIMVEEINGREGFVEQVGQLPDDHEQLARPEANSLARCS